MRDKHPFSYVITWVVFIGFAAALPIPLHGVPAVTGDGLIYVVGGSTTAAANSDRLFAFRPGA